MRPRATVLALVVFLSCSPVLFAQSTIPSLTTIPNSIQAATALQGAFSALTGSSTVNDVTLAGTARRIAGSNDETGIATYKALPSANRLDMVFSGSIHSEIRSNGAGLPSGTWIGPDGVAHAMAGHNLMSDAGWFPIFTLGNLISSSNTVLTYVGQETRDGNSLIHISASQQSPDASPDVSTLLQHLTQVEIYLDPSTLLPLSYVFDSHPDDNALIDIPTEIRYSNYQNVGGTQIPFHVQKLINNTLVLDLQFQNASLNTGVTSPPN